MTPFPAPARRFARQNSAPHTTTTAMISTWLPMLTQMAVGYRGASDARKMYEPAMPPRALHPLTAAATVARFPVGSSRG